MQIVVARFCSVEFPRLQIRLARFDSGPRLHSLLLQNRSALHRDGLPLASLILQGDMFLYIRHR